MNEKQMNKLYTQLRELEDMIKLAEKSNLTVSAVSVGWHIEHTLLVIIKVAHELEKSNPVDFKWTFNLKRILICSLKIIPRGRGKAPKGVVPTNFDTQTLNARAKEAENSLEILKKLGEGHYFKHPYFGDLKLKATLKFLTIHTQHHLKIIHDIIK